MQYFSLLHSLLRKHISKIKALSTLLVNLMFIPHLARTLDKHEMLW